MSHHEAPLEGKSAAVMIGPLFEDSEATLSLLPPPGGGRRGPSSWAPRPAPSWWARRART